MNWNSFYNDLLYYILGLYPNDYTHANKRRLIELAGIRPGEFNFNLGEKDLWFTILKYAIARNRIVQLLTVIIEDVGPPADEYLNGALQSILTGKTPRDPELPAKDWKGGNDVQVTREKITGKRSNLLPISFLEAGSRAARAVVRLELAHETGTAFLVANGWLLTNNHLIPDVATARTALLQFNFQSMENLPVAAVKLQRIKPELELSLDPGPGEFYTDAENDWTVVKMREADREKYEHYGCLTFSDIPAQEGDFVNIIQHPLGGPKQLGIYNNMVVYKDDKLIQYLTDTNDGSSGSPVLNSDWQVVAVHHGGGWFFDKKTGTTVKRNQGATAGPIVAKLKELNH